MSDAETLPRPEEVLDDDRIQYQAMTDLSEDAYQRLAEDIRDRGVLQPIITDESGTILDGHHRAALAEHLDLDESREPAYVVLGDLDNDDDKLARAIKQNVLGRDTGDAVKTHAVKQYIETAWDRTSEGNLIRPETDTEVAERLGVDQSLVGRVVKNMNAHIIYHERIKAREYYEDNPEASYREVSRQVDASRPTVTEWLKEDFDEGDDEDDDSDGGTSLAAFARNESEAEKAEETFEKATDEEADDEVQETAKEKAAEISRNKKTPKEAKNEVDIATETAEIEPLPEREKQLTIEDTDEPLQVLNLYAGIGGNRQLWGDDVDVTAVERDSDIASIYRDNFPQDSVVEADAHEYLLEHLDEFDFIWSSPPCPTHSQMERVNHKQGGLRYPDMSLYQEVILLKNNADYYDFEYCVENVTSYYDPLIQPQEVGRHYYWSTVEVQEVDTPLLRKRSDESRSERNDTGSGFDRQRHEKVLGFDLSPYDLPDKKKNKALKNCVQPQQGKAILDAVIAKRRGDND